MRLASRVGVLLALLAVPLLLALASQSLAARPGAPAVPDDVVRLGDRASGPGVTTPEGTAAPTADPTAPAPSAPAASALAPSAPVTSPPAAPDAPRVVAPAPERPAVADSDDTDDRDDTDEQDDDD